MDKSALEDSATEEESSTVEIPFSPVEKVKSGFAIAAQALVGLDDAEIIAAFGDESFDRILRAIADPTKAGDYLNLQEFVLANKNRLSILTMIRNAINQSYTLEGVTENGIAFIQVTADQWFTDGVMYQVGATLEGGRLARYLDGRISFAVTTRDVRAGDQIEPTDFEWIDIERAEEFHRELILERSAPLEIPLRKLEALLDSRNNDESSYQQVLEKHPWILGANYSYIRRHENLDEQNVPDFMGIRVMDSCRDIIEIKPPFAKIFKSNNQFNAAFHEYYGQAGRYLDFVHRNESYLFKKGLRFENPQCYLIIGYKLNAEQVEQVRQQERINSAIHIITYDWLLKWVKGTIQFMNERSVIAERAADYLAFTDVSESSPDDQDRDQLSGR